MNRRIVNIHSLCVALFDIVIREVAEAANAIFAYRVRSIMTMIGMTVGIFAVTFVFGLSYAASGAIAQSLKNQTIAPLEITMLSDSPAGPAFTRHDVAFVQRTLASVIHQVEPSVFAPVNASAAHESVNANLAALDGREQFKVGDGRMLSASDVQQAAHVCVISQELANALTLADPVGKTIRVDGDSFTIRGILLPSGGLFGTVTGRVIGVPFTSLRRVAPTYSTLKLWPQDGVSNEQAAKAVINAFQPYHAAGAHFSILDANRRARDANNILSIFRSALTALGALSVIVAGIGVWNIIMVSIDERVREIGIRKAIGAKNIRIMSQVLLQASILSTTSGVLGTCCAIAGCAVSELVLSRILGASPMPYATMLSGGILISLLIGPLFGAYPALYASRLTPIEALRV